MINSRIENDNLPKRKNIRLMGYDYSSNGAYFITICTEGRKCLLCENIDVGAHSVRPGQELPLSAIGQIVDKAILNIPHFYPCVSVEKYCIMPNHIHLIFLISPENDIKVPAVSQIIKQMKEYTTKQSGFSFWQKSFYDHIIRNEQDLKDIWRYIDENPLKWRDDKYYSVL